MITSIEELDKALRDSKSIPTTTLISNLGLSNTSYSNNYLTMSFSDAKRNIAGLNILVDYESKFIGMHGAINDKLCDIRMMPHTVRSDGNNFIFNGSELNIRGFLLAYF